MIVVDTYNNKPVVSIAQRVFKGCTALSTVYFEETEGWVRSGRITPEEPETMDDAEGIATMLRSSSDYWNRS